MLLNLKKYCARAIVVRLGIYCLIFVLLVVLEGGSKMAYGYSQIHASLGTSSGTYTGANNTYNHTGTNTVQAEYESFFNSNSAVFFKGVVAMNTTSGMVAYLGGFFGNRYYLGSSGMAIEESDSQNVVSSRPRYRFFVGWDFGVVDVNLREYDSGVVLHSVAFDAGAHGGAIYPINKNWGVEARIGYSYAFGFTVYAVSGSTMTALVGITLNYK
ncbi:MAG: hypothetical protein A2504_09000 [Bdellovibrionales bacterium RIFOXYD12_FULL_39_22]|nr:MAG: hypothetical protein A2385_13515 [Bdellovibrionales bacterium RIFOXYB1_FULL_39_21]OFZ40893.1 MAG: hypothetical protein A2485_16230 [Bdellovibrionales bacterium RIFOXYC12_FULL_39_17]OFZ44763.1 MAG: hypothetical protein A2404_10890 [Bdellovibrionales bacterium RIFOXYC1_FULL_39_130]OFZ72228.1 MAG: hypothetical protein A2451_16855 [Bdellovibrionales bacterium RIFOXYC2_FULL_39_8]OFZ74215.1 MAG: hypothetical protein A2560_03555 [Bdellovibrionales bacterium RIFOXYD1_FULL_39_84]OFZ92095.1 MAG: